MRWPAAGDFVHRSGAIISAQVFMRWTGDAFAGRLRSATKVGASSAELAGVIGSIIFCIRIQARENLKQKQSENRKEKDGAGYRVPES